MNERALERALMLARQGDTCAREELIKNHKTFIAQISSRVCNRYLTWDNDDELSVALLAFNEAIDKYKPDEGAAFHTYARKVIHGRLVDHFRKESRHKHVSLSPMDPEEEELSRYDAECSCEQYYESEQQAVFSEVVEKYITVLRQYGITLDDLVKVSPKHRDSKETLMNVAQKLSCEPELMHNLKKNKLLPLKELELLTGVKRRVLEKGRKYLIAIAIILSDPNFHSLKNFIETPGN